MPLRGPVELERLRGPEALPVALGVVVDGRVGVERGLAERLGRRERAALLQQRFERLAIVSLMPAPLPGRRLRRREPGRLRLTRRENVQRRGGRRDRPDRTSAAASVTRLRPANASRSPMCARASHVRRPRSTSSSMPRSRSQSACDSSHTSANPGTRARRRTSCSRTTSAVMSCSPGASSGRPAALVRAVRAQPAARSRAREAAARRRRSRSPRSATVAEHPAARLEPRVDARGIGSRAPAGPASPGGDIAAHARVAGFGGHEHLGELAVARSATRTSCQRAPSHSAMPNGRLSSSSLASTTPSSSSAGSSSSATNTGPVPATGHGASSRRRPRERPERLVGRLELERVALFVPQRGRALDEHVVQRRCARRARRAARHARVGRCPRPPRSRRTDPGRPSSRHRRSSARATHAPNSEPTSGLVTKSRPARPAPRPGREEAGPRLVQRELDEPVERDRPFAPDQAGDRLGRAAAPARTPAPRSVRRAAGTRRSRPRPRP